MTVKCCGTCSKVTDMYNAAGPWCLLVDEPVKFDECCESWSEE